MGKYIDTPAPSLAWLEGDLMGLGVRSLEIQDFILFTWPLPCAWGGYDYLYFAEEETEVQRGPVTCSMSKGQSWDINVGHLSSTPWGLVRMGVDPPADHAPLLCDPDGQ